MSIIIEDMIMPKSCVACPFEHNGDCYGGKSKLIMDIEDFNYYRHPNCPLKEVVRCKDCKWWHTDGVCKMLSSNHYPVVYMEADDFCARGKRKDERGMTPKTLTSIVVVFRINGVKYGRRMNFETEVAEEHIGFTKTVLETLMRGMKTQAVIDDYKVYDEVIVLDEVEE